MFDGAELDEQVGLLLAEQELDDEQEMRDGGVGVQSADDTTFGLRGYSIFKSENHYLINNSK